VIYHIKRRGLSIPFLDHDALEQRRQDGEDHADAESLPPHHDGSQPEDGGDSEVPAQVGKTAPYRRTDEQDDGDDEQNDCQDDENDGEAAEATKPILNVRFSHVFLLFLVYLVTELGEVSHLSLEGSEGGGELGNPKARAGRRLHRGPRVEHQRTLGVSSLQLGDHVVGILAARSHSEWRRRAIGEDAADEVGGVAHGGFLFLTGRV